MSKIEFEQIGENEVEVVIPPETPMQMVQQLVKSFVARGLVEDLQKSTLSVRYFSRPQDKVNTVADELIKSLSRLAKDDELPYWHPKSQFANRKRVREMEIAERRAKQGIKQPTNVSPAPEPHIMPDPAPKMPATAGVQPVTTPAAPTAPKMYDTTPTSMNTAGGTGRRYGTIGGPGVGVVKKEHPEGCQCDACLEMEKSNYGPKGGGQYSAADNSRRKSNNLTDTVGAGPNSNVKAYSTKPGQLSAKAQAGVTARIQAAASKKQPVKQWSAEQIAQENAKRGLKKGWGDHNPIPSAEEEIMRLAMNAPQVSGEDAAANQLAKMMQSKSLLNHNQPSRDEFLSAGEAMGLGVSEEMAKNAEKSWNGAINNWLVEATKPISQRFASEEEELAYWAKIKVNDSGGESGY